MIDRIESGLEILRREAKALWNAGGWPEHNTLMRRAQQHIEACSGDWMEYESRLKREFADLMNL